MEQELILSIICALWAVAVQKTLAWVLRRFPSSTIDQNNRHGAFFSPDVSAIPPQFGFFTPSSPTLQLREATYSCLVTFLLCAGIIFASIGAWGIRCKTQEARWLKVLKVWAAMQGLSIVAAAGLWIMACYDGVH
ncbi:hypothetical protein GGS24DRAFT_455571 [Hypoxylon argillaceum]|nr:hypothetical protein GGS24DRAFT_455571 [Hypoxylon argillaceum]